MLYQKLGLLVLVCFAVQYYTSDIFLNQISVRITSLLNFSVGVSMTDNVYNISVHDRPCLQH